jgi:hypothetical protein
MRIETQNKFFSERSCLSEDEFFERFYATSGIHKELLVEIVNHIAHEIGLPAGILRPADRFDVELAPTKGTEWDSGYAILVYEIQRLAKNKGIIIEGKIATVDDCIRKFAVVY